MRHRKVNILPEITEPVRRARCRSRLPSLQNVPLSLVLYLSNYQLDRTGKEGGGLSEPSTWQTPVCFNLKRTQ
jgi:hypothetical protein